MFHNGRPHGPDRPCAEALSRAARGVRARSLAAPDLPRGQRPGQDVCIAAEDGSSIRLKADSAEREALVAQGDPFYVPPYVGTHGWVGIELDHARTDWEEVAELIATAYHLIAPKRLAQQVKSPPSLDR